MQVYDETENPASLDIREIFLCRFCIVLTKRYDGVTTMASGKRRVKIDTTARRISVPREGFKHYDRVAMCTAISDNIANKHMADENLFSRRIVILRLRFREIRE